MKPATPPQLEPGPETTPQPRKLKPATLRLVLAAGLFAVWIGYLAYLAVTAGTQPITRKGPIVLSRPQFLVSDLDVIAQIDEVKEPPEPTEVTIVDIVWSKQQAGPKEVLRVTNLPACQGWVGPGRYILPLMQMAEDEHTYEVAPIPRSPGIDHHFPRIYPLTDQTREQLEQLVKDKPAQ
jgi:hypothetical protein